MLIAGRNCGIRNLENGSKFIGGRDQDLFIRMGVNIRGHLDVRMAHECLGGPDVDAGLLEIRAVGVPEAVCHKIVREWDDTDVFLRRGVDPCAHRQVHVVLEILP